MSITKSDEAIKALENLLSDKQKNGTIKNISEEIAFLGGGIAMMRSESINDFKYNK